MPRVASALLAVALLLPACAAPAAETLSPAASAPSVVAGQYLDLVATSNAATCTFNAVLSQTAPTLADLTRASAAYATSLAALTDGLQAIAWTGEVAGDANDLISALATNESLARAMAAADSLAAFITADDQLIAANAVSAAAAKQLRDDLGLPSSGNPCLS